MKPWEEDLKNAMEKGYDPGLDPRAIRARDEAINELTKARNELANTKAMLDTQRESAKLAKETADKLAKDLDEARAASQDASAMREELDRFRKQAAEQQAENEANLEKLKAAWETAKPGSSKAVPDFKTPAEQLRWMKENAALFDMPSEPTTVEVADGKEEITTSNTPKKAPPTGQPTSTNRYPQEIKDWAERAGVPPEKAFQMLQRRNEKLKQNKQET